MGSDVIQGATFVAVLAMAGFLWRVFDKRFDSLTNEVNGRFDRFAADVNVRFDKVDAKFDRVDARFDKVHERLGTLERRFDGLEGRRSRRAVRFLGGQGRWPGHGPSEAVGADRRVSRRSARPFSFVTDR